MDHVFHGVSYVIDLLHRIQKKRTLIVGAGSAGTMIARQLLKNDEADLYPTAFVDDDPNKLKLQIYGIDVKGTSLDIPRLVEELNIRNIVIAIPSFKKVLSNLTLLYSV